MAPSLPLLPDAPCDGCHGRCCSEHRVPIDGFELVRLMRAVGGEWRELVDLESMRSPLFLGFRIDAGAEHWSLYLRRHDDGACRFLVGPDGARRCGVHVVRPGACRAYPGALDEGRPFVSVHAICPPERAAAWGALLAREPESLWDDEADRALWLRTLRRWDLCVRRAPRSVDDFVAWIDALDARLAPLRSGERGRWQLAAYACIDDFPLP
ncbi:MAG TPA: YkgJ family cysteine cluster protein [Polyangia bacterium]|nr:YkgJ family cysteine cluster protein [Polyangia bacterium]